MKLSILIRRVGLRRGARPLVFLRVRLLSIRERAPRIIGLLGEALRPIRSIRPGMGVVAGGADERRVSVACARVPRAAAGPDVPGTALGLAHIWAAPTQGDRVERERLFDDSIVSSAADEESHDADDENEADKPGEAQNDASEDFVLQKGLL